MAINLPVLILIGVIVLKLVYEQIKIEVIASRPTHRYRRFVGGW